MTEAPTVVAFILVVVEVILFGSSDRSVPRVCFVAFPKISHELFRTPICHNPFLFFCFAPMTHWVLKCCMNELEDSESSQKL